MKRTTKLVIIGASLIGAVSLQADVDANWKKNCASCHGQDGSGKTAMGKRLKVGDYTDPAVQDKFTDEEAIKVTKEGIEKDGKQVMKPYADKLSDEEIKELVAKIRSFKQ